MARFSGKIGYGESQEIPESSGVWEDVITEFTYFGDVIRNTKNVQNGEKINDNISVGNSISIVADEYANGHWFNIRYVIWQGIRWEVTEVEVNSPRLILRLGSVYNGPIPEEV